MTRIFRMLLCTGLLQVVLEDRALLLGPSELTAPDSCCGCHHLAQVLVWV